MMRRRRERGRKAVGLMLIAAGLAISPIPPEGVETVLLIALFPFFGSFAFILLLAAGLMLIAAGLVLL
jgi:hypothetical protein